MNSENITAFLVPETARMGFLPAFFGERLMLRGERLVYGWMNTLAPEDYKGGFWKFYCLSNGGFYMAPDIDDELHILCEGNDFSGDLSADAAGIVATLFALCQLTNESASQYLNDLYYLLRQFATTHPESSKIFAAID